MKKGTKKWVLFLLLMIMTFTCCIPVNAQTQKQKALKAYATYMAKKPAGTVKFCLAYVDNNSVPELIIKNPWDGKNDGIQVVTYIGGKVKSFHVNYGPEAYEFGYYPKKGVFRITGGTLIPCHEYYRLKNGKITLLFGYDETVEDDGENDFYYYKATNGKRKEYPYGADRISKSTFQKLLKQNVGNTKFTRCKYYKNTAGNRTKYLGSVASIKLNKNKGTVYVGKYLQLKATVTGASKKVSWSTGNKHIATVNSKGKVTGKKAGKTTITAKANGKIAKCTVTVKKK